MADYTKNGEKMEDYLPYIGTYRTVEFEPFHGTWLKGIVFGINLIRNTLLIQTMDNQNETNWYPLFLQTTLKNPDETIRTYHIRIPQ